MNITTSPKTKQITYREIDFLFSSGHSTAISLKPDDTISVPPNGIGQPGAYIVTYADTGEVIEIDAQKLDFVSSRYRTVEVEVSDDGTPKDKPLSITPRRKFRS